MNRPEGKRTGEDGSMAERKVSVRLGVIGGKQVEDQLRRIGTTGSDAFRKVGRDGAQAFGQIERASGSGRAAIANTAFQIQDLAVQIAGGTSASRALAQQLPQLLGGLGLMGAVAGAAAAPSFAKPLASTSKSTSPTNKNLRLIVPPSNKAVVCSHRRE
jgi:hypothetical protein